MRRLCLWPSEHTRTKNNEGIYGISLKWLTNKHMRWWNLRYSRSKFSLLVVTSEFTSNCSMYGFWFKKNKYNHCVHELILIFKSKSQIAVWKMNLLTEHFPVYDNNTYLNAEKNKEDTKFPISDFLHVYWIKSINLPLN